MPKLHGLKFRESEPVKRAPRAGAGRKPDPNPFIDLVREIANKRIPPSLPGGEWKPRTVMVEVTLAGGRDPDEEYARWYRKNRRQLTAAGKIVAKEKGAPAPYLISRDIRLGGMGTKSIVPVYELRIWHSNQPN